MHRCLEDGKTGSNWSIRISAWTTTSCLFLWFLCPNDACYMRAAQLRLSKSHVREPDSSRALWFSQRMGSSCWRSPCALHQTYWGLNHLRKFPQKGYTIMKTSTESACFQTNWISTIHSSYADISLWRLHYYWKSKIIKVMEGKRGQSVSEGYPK